MTTSQEVLFYTEGFEQSGHICDIKAIFEKQNPHIDRQTRSIWREMIRIDNCSINSSNLSLYATIFPRMHANHQAREASCPRVGGAPVAIRSKVLIILFHSLSVSESHSLSLFE